MGIALDVLNKLEVVEFRWKNDDLHDIGLIAEEVEKVLPEAVIKKDGIIMGLKPLTLIAILIKALKEVQDGGS